MTHYEHQMTNRLLELLCYPLEERMHELNALLDRCSLRDLQDAFPIIVRSIFGVGSGNLGWGLRIATRDNVRSSFAQLIQFFGPTGPMLRMCYRLLNDAIKFDFDLDLLPHKVLEMLQTGQYSMFYADLVNIDTFQRQVVSLSLNSFDYYILHFVLHATYPLHKVYPSAKQVHSDNLITAYYQLVAEYLSAFLPCNPETAIMPLSVSSVVKSLQPVPVQPKRSPRYLKIPNTSPFTGSGTSQSSPVSTPLSCRSCGNNIETPRSSIWRSETIIHFFIDVWFRFDFETVTDLPSSEFIRVVRVLVKHCHYLANTDELEHTTMAIYQKAALSMIKPRIYPMLRALIDRWPMDSSFQMVLELWLSYLQPWRYTPGTMTLHGKDKDVPISNQFDPFIVENLAVYTQLFLHFFPRLERLDYTVPKHVGIVYRFIKAFTQDTLPEKLFQAERAYVGHVSMSFERSSPEQGHYTKLHASSPTSGNSVARSCEWAGAYMNDLVYKPLFSADMQFRVRQLLQTLYMTQKFFERKLSNLEQTQRDSTRGIGLLLKFLKTLIQEKDVHLENNIAHIRQILRCVTTSIQLFALLFNVDVPHWADGDAEEGQESNGSSRQSLNSSNQQMQVHGNMPNAPLVQVDPALLPIASYENKWLVHFLHQISSNINDMYGCEIHELYTRPDLVGKLARLILYPPMVAKWFDKPRGINELCEEELPPRLCLRPLASYHTLSAIAATVLVFYLWTRNVLTAMVWPLILYFLYMLGKALLS